MSAIIRSINTASGFKEHQPAVNPHLVEGLHPKLDKKVKIRVPLFFWWLCWSDPYLGREGTVINIEWHTQHGETLYTILFGDSDTGVKQIYSGRNLEFLEE